MEVPESFTKNISDKYTLTSQKKGTKRYLTDQLQGLIDRLGECERDVDLIISSSIQTIFSRFLEKIDVWRKVTSALAKLDCLFSLAKFSRGDAYMHQQNVNMAQPEFAKNVEGAESNFKKASTIVFKFKLT